MTDDKIALRALPEKGSNTTFLREMIGFAGERLMALETDTLLARKCILPYRASTEKQRGRVAVQIKGYVDPRGGEAIEGWIYNAGAPQTRIVVDSLAAAWLTAGDASANGQAVAHDALLNGAILLTDMSRQVDQNLWMASSNLAHG